MKSILLFALFLLLPFLSLTQPGFNKKYLLDSKSFGFFNILHDNGKLVLPGLVNLDTLPSETWGWTYTEMDTNGLVLYDTIIENPDYIGAYSGSPILKLRDGRIITAAPIYWWPGYMLGFFRDRKLETFVRHVDSTAFYYVVSGLCETDDGIYMTIMRQGVDFRILPIVRKFDKSGAFIWEKQFDFLQNTTTVCSIIARGNNSLFIAGGSAKAPGPVQTQWTRSYIANIDSSGNLIHKWISDSNEEYIITAIQSLPDGGWLYSAIGGKFSQDGATLEQSTWAVRRDSNFNLVWKKKLNNTIDAYISDIALTPDGNWVATSSWLAYPVGFFTTSVYKYTLDGTRLWHKDNLYVVYPEGGHQTGGIEVLPSGSILTAGWVTQWVPDGDSYAWLLKMNADGCIYFSDGCGGFGAVEEDSNLSDLVGQIEIYPNPISDFFTIETPVRGRVLIFDIKGRPVLEMNVEKGSNSFDLSKQPSGSYVLTFDTNRFSITRKISKL